MSDLHTLRVVTPPLVEAVSLPELRKQLEIDQAETYHDAQLALVGRAARQYYERRTGRTIHETEYDLILNRWPAGRRIVLPRATPLLSVDPVQMVDDQQVTTLWSDFLLDTYSEVGAIVLKPHERWPDFTPSPVAPITIRYRAGIPASPAVEAEPEDKVPILMLAGALFENRETEIVKTNTGLESIVLRYGIEPFIGARQVHHVY